MKLTVIIIFLSALLSCSFQNSNDKRINHVIIEPNGKYFKSVYPFGDSNYVFTFRTIDTTKSYDNDKPTAAIHLLYLAKEKVDTLINDSLFSRNHWAADPELQIEFEDFNFDGVMDIILAAGSDPRSNHGFHLYLVDKKRKKIKYVQGFQDIGNPKPDSVNKLISSFVLSGQHFYQFYFIDKSNSLQKLGPNVEADLSADDSIRFQKALDAAIKEKQKYN